MLTKWRKTGFLMVNDELKMQNGESMYPCRQKLPSFLVPSDVSIRRIYFADSFLPSGRKT